MNTPVTRSLKVDTNERALTFVELDPTMTKQFTDTNVLIEGNFLYKKPLPVGAMSADFPLYGINNMERRRHTPGQYIEGQNSVKGKVNVEIDDPLIWAYDIPLVDVENCKWDAVEPEAKNVARNDSDYLDVLGFRHIVKAARTAASAGLHDGGLRVTYQAGDGTLEAALTLDSTGGTVLVNLFNRASLLADRRKWPSGPQYRIMFMDPYAMAVGFESSKFTSKDYMDHPTLPGRKVVQFMGWTLIPTTHLPSGDADTTDLSKYQVTCTGAASNTARPLMVGLCLTNERGAVGYVDGPMYDKVIFDERRDTWLVKRRRVTGMGVVEPWKAIEVGVYAA